MAVVLEFAGAQRQGMFFEAALNRSRPVVARLTLERLGVEPISGDGAASVNAIHDREAIPAMSRRSAQRRLREQESLSSDPEGIIAPFQLPQEIGDRVRGLQSDQQMHVVLNAADALRKSVQPAYGAAEVFVQV